MILCYDSLVRLESIALILVQLNVLFSIQHYVTKLVHFLTVHITIAFYVCMCVYVSACVATCVLNDVCASVGLMMYARYY